MDEKTNWFVERARKIHGNKYDYSKVEYKGLRNRVCIICPEHGEFWQTPEKHLLGRDCRLCANKKISRARKDTLEDFLRKAKAKYGDKYDYSKVNYVNSTTKVEIICKKHGSFYVAPATHLMHVGCPICRNSHLENKVRGILLAENIEFVQHYSPQWLGRQHLDIYLSKLGVAIECQGKQHFKAVEMFGGEEALEKTQQRDKEKAEKCKANGIELIYFSDRRYGQDGIITTKSKLIEKLKELHD